MINNANLEINLYLLSCINESTIYLLNDKDLILLYESIGPEGLRRIQNMAISHIGRDKDKYYASLRGVYTKSPVLNTERNLKDYIKSGKSEKTDFGTHRPLSTEKKQEFVNKAKEKLGTDHPYTIKKQDELEKLKSDSKSAEDKTNHTISKRYNLFTMTKDGGGKNYGHAKILDKSESGNPNSYEKFHSDNNARRRDAKDRLLKYLDGYRKVKDNNDSSGKKTKLLPNAGKEYDDNEYTKKHDKNIGTRVNPARGRHNPVINRDDNGHRTEKQYRKSGVIEHGYLYFAK